MTDGLRPVHRRIEVGQVDQVTRDAIDRRWSTQLR